MNSFLKRYTVFAFAALLLATQAKANHEMQDSLTASRVTLKRDGSYLTVSMTLHLDGAEAKGDRAILLTPLLENEEANKALRPVGIYSRSRYYHYARRDKERMLGGADELSYKDKDKPDTLAYRVIIPYEPWMDGASLTLLRQDYGCCDKVIAEQSQTIGRFARRAEFVPQLAYVQPEVERVKVRALAGTAYIDFRVNRTEIRPDYRNNRRELDKIIATIDSVRADKDITVTSLSIKGYASPEGSYAGNARLAAGRTEALKRYLTDRYHFTDTLFVTDYEPENWEGLRAYVAQSDLADKDDILTLIDSDLEPDAKETRLKREHPESYRHLLAECYPGLRRSDYVVTYQIRGFNVDEAKERISTDPQKLSLQEMFAVAQTYRPGSEEFKQVFDVAVRMYPADPIANLNAANALLENGQAAEAKPYLEKAGDSPQAANARAVALLLQRRYNEALPLLQQAKEAGLPEAEENMKIFGKK